jgi:hypothetical protein
MGAPTLLSLVPNTCAFTDPPFVMTLNGADFDEATTVNWGGMPIVPDVFVSATELRVQIDPATATYDANTNSAEIWCANGDQWSAILTFQFTQQPIPPGPTPDSGSTDYMKPDPPNVYQKVVEDTKMPSVAAGHPVDPLMPTTNAYADGGLPMRPKEPYPTGVVVPETGE